MSTINQIISLWEKNKNVEDILSQNISFPNEHDIRAHIEQLSEQQRNDFNKIFHEIIHKLDTYTSNLLIEKEQIQEQIEQIGKTASACISYKTAQHTSNIKPLSAHKKTQD